MLFVLKASFLFLAIAVVSPIVFYSLVAVARRFGLLKVANDCLMSLARHRSKH